MKWLFSGPLLHHNIVSTCSVHYKSTAKYWWNILLDSSSSNGKIPVLCFIVHFWPTYRASYHRQANVALSTIDRYRYYSKNIWNFSVLCNRSSNVDAIVLISLSTENPKHVPLVPPPIDRPVCRTVSLAASSCLSITQHYTLALVNEMISSLSSSQEHKYTQSLGRWCGTRLAAYSRERGNCLSWLSSIGQNNSCR